MSAGGFKRVLGFWPAFAACFGVAISGSTIMLLGNGFGIVGPAFIISQLVAVAIMVLVVLAFSELSTMMPAAGGIEVYTREALGPVMASSVTLWYYVCSASIAVNALVDGSILNMFLPQLTPLVWGILLVTIYFILNLLGAKVIGFGAAFSAFGVIATYIILAVIAFAGIGLAKIDFSNLTPFARLGAGGTWAWAMLAFWMFVGIEMATPLAEEVKDPERTLPRAMIAGLICIFLIQLLLGPAMLGVLSPEEITSLTPHVAFAQKILGMPGLVWVVILQILLEFTTIGGVMFSVSRILYGLGRDGMLPRVFAAVHPKFGTPWASITLIYVTVVVAMLFGAPLQLLSISSMVFLAIYGLALVDLWVLRRKQPQAKRPFLAGGPFRNPFLAIVGLAGIAVVLVGNVLQDRLVLYWGLPITLACVAFSRVWFGLQRKKVEFRQAPGASSHVGS